MGQRKYTRDADGKRVSLSKVASDGPKPKKKAPAKKKKAPAKKGKK